MNPISFGFISLDSTLKGFQAYIYKERNDLLQICGSSLSYLLKNLEKRGLDRDLNPGPLAPEARIIPLDHRADVNTLVPDPNLVWRSHAKFHHT